MFRNKKTDIDTFVDTDVDRVVAVVTVDSKLVVVAVAVDGLDAVVVAGRVGPTRVSISVT